MFVRRAFCTSCQRNESVRKEGLGKVEKDQGHCLRLLCDGVYDCILYVSVNGKLLGQFSMSLFVLVASYGRCRPASHTFRRGKRTK